jgi:hypothetical protein
MLQANPDTTAADNKDQGNCLISWYSLFSGNPKTARLIDKAGIPLAKD